MESERRIVEAKRVLREFRGRIGTRSSRIHDDTMADNSERQRALDGLCGNCQNIKIIFRGSGRARSIMLFCTERYIPVELYAKTTLGEAADCPGFTPRS